MHNAENSIASGFATVKPSRPRYSNPTSRTIHVGSENPSIRSPPGHGTIPSPAAMFLA
jgi:hypothetical protein